METSAISYRVADFLKQHPPFTLMEERDLVALAANGRVRFFEPHEFILWQGEPHKLHVFVIQQGTVTLWDERDGEAQLRDVRGAGDLLGAEQFNGVRACLFSARSASDVVVYGFPATDVDELLAKYPYARQFVAALGEVVADFQRPDGHADPGRMFLHGLAGALPRCTPEQSLGEAAGLLARSGAGAVAVVDDESRLRGLVTTDILLGWVAEGGGNTARPVADLPLDGVPTLGPDASVADGVLAMGASPAAAVALTTDGSPGGRVLSLLTPRDLAPVFGDQPSAILHEIRRAPDLPGLRSLNQRARACALHYLTSAASTEWIARFTAAVDVGILTRLIALTAAEEVGGCWCVCGPSGRGESIAARQPQVTVLLEATVATPRALDRYRRVVEGLAQCGYVPHGDDSPETSFHVATAGDWSRRYRTWMRDPVIEGMARRRAIFDLRPAYGDRALWEAVRDDVARAVDRDILRVLAHDCLASLPPLTFYQDAVVDPSGEHLTVFRLEHSALAPLVDLGRVFGMAARDVMGTSTVERLALARRLLPAHERIFREAADTLRIVLWQQGRVGISQGTAGTELPPSLLSRHDRHLLKSGFRAIHQLLDFSADPAWLDAI